MRINFYFYKVLYIGLYRIGKFTIKIFTIIAKFMWKWFGWVLSPVLDLFKVAKKLVWEFITGILDKFNWLLKRIGWIAVKLKIIDKSDIDGLQKALTDLIKAPGDIIKEQTAILDKHIKAIAGVKGGRKAETKG